MFRGRVGHHGYLELGHVLQLLVGLNALLETVDFLLKLKVFVREEGCAWRGLKIDQTRFLMKTFLFRLD